MPTYSIQAPNGRTYEIEGPAGATEEQVRAEILRRDPSSATPAPKERSLIGAVGEGLFNIPGHLGDAWHAATVDLPNTIIDPKRRQAAGQALGQTLSNMGDTAKGYIQQVRDLSPAEFQGSAPRMNTAPAQAMESGVVQKYGVNVSPQRLAQAVGGDLGQPNLNAYRTMKNDIAEHPLAVAATVAPFVGKPLGEALSRMPSVSMPNPVKAASNFLDAGMTPTGEAMRGKALGAVVARRQGISDLEATAAKLKSGDAPLRSAMETAAEAKAAAGVGMSDLPEAQQLVADLKGKLNPKGAVITKPTAEQAKAYQAIIDTLTPANGQKPSREMVENLRRQLAKSTYGVQHPQGFDAINAIEKDKLVNRLYDLEDAYTEGAGAPVRQNWAAYRNAADQVKDIEASGIKPKLDAQIIELDNLNTKQVATRAKTIVRQMAEKGLLSEADYNEMIQLANDAQTAAGKSALRKKFAMFGLGVAGMGAIGAPIGHAVGVIP